MAFFKSLSSEVQATSQKQKITYKGAVFLSSAGVFFRLTGRKVPLRFGNTDNRFTKEKTVEICSGDDLTSYFKGC
jgi:hypothetical protein